MGQVHLDVTRTSASFPHIYVSIYTPDDKQSVMKQQHNREKEGFPGGQKTLLECNLSHARRPVNKCTVLEKKVPPLQGDGTA